MLSDPNYWDDSVQATAPQPRRDTPATRAHRPQPIGRKQQGDAPAVSMDEQRLRQLRDWVMAKLGCIEDTGSPISHGAYEDDDDAPRIVQLAKAGLLGKGRRLKRVDLGLTPQPETLVELQFATARLQFSEMLLQHRKD